LAEFPLRAMQLRAFSARFSCQVGRETAWKAR
jgi:hypothetical protein